VTWAKFDDNFADHPKVFALSDGAFRLHVHGICYCARYLTDGVLPAGQVPRLTPNYEASHLRELVRTGLWVHDGNEYLIHDYLEWNTARAKVLAARAARSKGGRKGAEKRWRDGDGSE
jgi:hypothetical protein